MQNKRLNLILSNGLCVVSSRTINESIVMLFITDYSNNCRIIFDKENKKILVNKYDIKFTEKDVNSLMTALNGEKK